MHAYEPSSNEHAEGRPASMHIRYKNLIIFQHKDSRIRHLAAVYLHCNLGFIKNEGL